MASLIVLTRARTILSPTIISKFHHPFTARSVHSIDTEAYLRDPEYKQEGGSTDKNPRPPIVNPFQVSGPKGVDSTKIDYMGMHLRRDMPGVDKDCEVWMEKEKGILLYKAKAPYDRREKDDDYLYMVIKKSPTACYKLDQIKAKLKDGVLRILLPFKY